MQLEDRPAAFHIAELDEAAVFPVDIRHQPDVLAIFLYYSRFSYRTPDTVCIKGQPRRLDGGIEGGAPFGQGKGAVFIHIGAVLAQVGVKGREIVDIGEGDGDIPVADQVVDGVLQAVDVGDKAPHHVVIRFRAALALDPVVQIRLQGVIGVRKRLPGIRRVIRLGIPGRVVLPKQRRRLVLAAAVGVVVILVAFFENQVDEDGKHRVGLFVHQLLSSCVIWRQVQFIRIDLLGGGHRFGKTGSCLFRIEL